jgi:hypothetical protein
LRCLCIIRLWPEKNATRCSGLTIDWIDSRDLCTVKNMSGPAVAQRRGLSERSRWPVAALVLPAHSRGWPNIPFIRVQDSRASFREHNCRGIDETGIVSPIRHQTHQHFI